jgi:Domain of unknown function (DUF4062)/prokaryotic YEATS domain
MDHKVFVSSTFVDLHDHRQAVRDAIRQLGAVDIAMENFGARDERPKKECLRLISSDCDSFVGIYAHRYGHVPPGCRRSITECEFEAATRAKLTRFVYIVDDDAPWKPKLIEGGTGGQRLEQFKKRLRAELIVKPFSNKDQLAMFVAADLGRYLATAQLKRIHPIAKGDRGSGSPASVGKWNKYRDGVYADRHGIFLAHTLSPSTTPGQLFDIFIFLSKHKAKDTPEIAQAEFFLGRQWGNKVFKIKNTGQLIGIATAAYGEFLCVCRVTLKDGDSFFLDRYIDFGTYGL